MEPGIASAQADQLLVQAVDRHTFRGESCGRLRKRRAYGIVAAEPVLLHAPERLFVARIDRRRAAAGEKYREGMRQMAPVCDAARQPCDIMVADERERRKTVEETVVAFERPGQFEEIAVLE